MPRYDDRYDGARLYVGHLSSRSRSHDIEDLFSRYGRVRGVDLKHDFAFVDFSDPRDADDARYHLDGRDFDGSRIVVEFAKGAPRGRGGSREYLGRGPPPGSGCCFNCGVEGHWARDCKAGDWKNKCYRCGERGHIERSCKNSPKYLRRGRSNSRSPSPRHGRSRSRSYSRSRSPPRRSGRSVEREERSRNPGYSRSRSRSPPPSRGGRRGPSPVGSRSPRERMSPSPKVHARTERNGSDYGESPRRGNSRSPMSQEQERSPTVRRSPKANGRSPSPGKYDDKNSSPRRSQSPQS